MEIIKESKLGTLVIREIPRDVAKEQIVNNHYSGKMSNSMGIINYGIYLKDDDRLLGSAVYGSLMNPASCSKIIKDADKQNIIELNRLWVDDELGKNAETMFLSATFSLLKQEHPEVWAVQSFADGRLGVGTIYKASNFKYYGKLQSVFYEDLETGETIHQAQTNNWARPKGTTHYGLRHIKGQLRQFGVNTYKYIYVLNKRKKKDVLLKEETYPEYQKGEIELKEPFNKNNWFARFTKEMTNEDFAKKYQLLYDEAKSIMNSTNIEIEKPIEIKVEETAEPTKVETLTFREVANMIFDFQLEYEDKGEYIITTHNNITYKGVK